MVSVFALYIYREKKTKIVMAYLETSTEHVNRTNNVNTTDVKFTFGNSMAPVTIFFLLITATFIINLLTCVILLKSKTLRSKRFNYMTLLLSANHIIFCISGYIIVAQMYCKAIGINIPYICFISVLLSYISVTFSLVQILFICIDRYLATFPDISNRKVKRRLDCMYVMSLVVIIFYYSTGYGVISNIESVSCKLSDVFGHNHRISLSTALAVRLTVYACIIILYIRTVLRLLRQVRSVCSHNDLTLMSNGNHSNGVFYSTTTSSTTVTSSQDHNHRSGTSPYALNCGTPSLDKNAKHGMTDISPLDKNMNDECNTRVNKMKLQTRKSIFINNNTTASVAKRGPDSSRVRRFKRTVVTLGVLILVISISCLPSMITNLISILTTVFNPDILAFTNIFALINPLTDPIIYVLRIKEYRSKIKCQSL